MRTIIHIGQHKTATTSIQSYLKIKQAQLAQVGLYVPDSLVDNNARSNSLLNVYALNQHRSSPKKDKLLAIKPPKFFLELKQHLQNDIAKHYQNANNQGCKDIIWSNEGLYLLNSIEEYKRLVSLFEHYSSEIICICSFRELEYYKISYIKHLKKRGINFSDDKESYRYIKDDSWLFDYTKKRALLTQVFNKVIFFPYDSKNMVKIFFDHIGYSATDGDSTHLNVT